MRKGVRSHKRKGKETREGDYRVRERRVGGKRTESKGGRDEEVDAIETVIGRQPLSEKKIIGKS